MQRYANRRAPLALEVRAVTGEPDGEMTRPEWCQSDKHRGSQGGFLLALQYEGKWGQICQSGGEDFADFSRGKGIWRQGGDRPQVATCMTKSGSASIKGIARSQMSRLRSVVIFANSLSFKCGVRPLPEWSSKPRFLRQGHEAAVVVHKSGTRRASVAIFTPLPLSGPPLSSCGRMQLAVLHRSPPVRPSVSGDHVGSVGHLHPRETGKLIFLGMREGPEGASLFEFISRFRVAKGSRAPSSIPRKRSPNQHLCPRPRRRYHHLRRHRRCGCFPGLRYAGQ